MSESRLDAEASGWFLRRRDARCKMRWRCSRTELQDYVYVCLHADRRTAQLRFRMAELAQAIGHSTRSLTTYLEELRRTEVSVVYRASNQHELGRIEILDRFWPYQKQAPTPTEDPEQAHSARVRGWFLEPACVTCGIFRRRPETGR